MNSLSNKFFSQFFNHLFQQNRTHNTAVSPSMQHHHSNNHHVTANMADTFSIDSSHYNDEQCGWSNCKPNKMQKLNSPKWFLFFLAVFSVSQSKFVFFFFQHIIYTLLKKNYTRLFSLSNITFLIRKNFRQIFLKNHKSLFTLVVR